MLAEALAAPLMRALAEEAAAPYEGPSRGDAGLAGVRRPMIPGNEESRTTLCLMQASRHLRVLRKLLVGQLGCDAASLLCLPACACRKISGRW